jgi:hypothetical protein
MAMAHQVDITEYISMSVIHILQSTTWLLSNLL